MRFLVDNSMSPRFAGVLAAAGHDAVHIRDIRPPDADDAIVFDLAADDERVVVAQDTDFGTLLALRRATRPSVVLFRRREKSAEAIAALLLAAMPVIEPDLIAGAIVVFDDTRIRVRLLPLR